MSFNADLLNNFCTFLSSNHSDVRFLKVPNCVEANMKKLHVTTYILVLKILKFVSGTM